MARDPQATRAAILRAAHDLVMEQGFAATSVDAIVTRAGITKGAFFHHFGSKAGLARALVERWAAMDAAQLEEGLDHAEAAASNPLDRLLHFVSSLEAEWNAADAPSPGCLFASFVYEAQLFDASTLEVIREAIVGWREALRALLTEVSAQYPPSVPVDLEALADMVTVIFEGAFIVARSMEDRAVVAAQLRQYRTYLELLFGRSTAEPLAGLSSS